MDVCSSLSSQLGIIFSDLEPAELNLDELLGQDLEGVDGNIDFESELFDGCEDTAMLVEAAKNLEEPWQDVAARMDSSEQEEEEVGIESRSSDNGRSKRQTKAVVMRVMRVNKKLRRAICSNLQTTDTTKVFYKQQSNHSKLELVSYDFSLPDDKRGLDDRDLCHLARQVSSSRSLE